MQNLQVHFLFKYLLSSVWSTDQLSAPNTVPPTLWLVCPGIIEYLKTGMEMQINM